MKIAIASPIYIPLLEPYLDLSARPFPAGMGGLSVTYLALGFLEHGIPISIYTLDPAAPTTQVLRGDLLTIYVGHYRARGRMRDFMRAERRLVEHFIRQDTPDIVNAHWTYEYGLGAIASGFPHLVTARDWAPQILRLQRDFYRLGRYLMNRACLAKARNLSANSKYIQDKLHRMMGRNCPLTPNSICDSMFRDSVKIPEHPLTICSLNNGFSIHKNVGALLKAFQLVRERIPGVRLALGGSEFGTGEIAEKWAKEQKLESGVQFLGQLPTPDLIRVLDSSDLLVHPSLEESFGMTLVEAMARKVPVVGGCLSGAVPWVLDEGKAGVLVDVQKPAAIADAILRFAQDTGYWQKYSEAGFLNAKSRFASSAVTDVYLSLFREILA